MSDPDACPSCSTFWYAHDADACHRAVTDHLDHQVREANQRFNDVARDLRDSRDKVKDLDTHLTLLRGELSSARRDLHEERSRAKDYAESSDRYRDALAATVGTGRDLTPALRKLVEEAIEVAQSGLEAMDDLGELDEGDQDNVEDFIARCKEALGES